MNTITTRKMRITSIMALLLATASIIYNATIPASAEQPRLAIKNLKASDQTQHRTITVNGLNIFYREAGPKNAPTILLLQGLPASSKKFLNIIPTLSKRFHVVVPDYPGYGNSDKPAIDEFNYTPDNLAAVMDSFVKKMGFTQYGLLVMEHGEPIAVRMTLKKPQQVKFLIVQKGDSYEDRLPDIKGSIEKYWGNRKPEHSKPLARLMKLGDTDRQDTLRSNNKAFYPRQIFNFRIPGDAVHPFRQQQNKLDIYLFDIENPALEDGIQVITDYIHQFTNSKIVSL